MKKVLFSLLLLTVLLSGCVCDDSELFGISDKKKNEEVGTPLNVTASISENTSNLRSIIDVTAFPNPSSIGVFTLDGGGTVANTKYDFTTVWATASPIYIVKPTATVYAYYPFATTTPATPTAAATITVTLGNESSFTGAGQTDYMWTGSAAVTKNPSPTASLTFKHALSKVSFVVKKGTNFVGAGSLTSVSLSKGGLTSATMKVVDGTIAGTSAAISFTGTATINEAAGSSITCYGLIAPVAAIGTTTLTMVIDGISYVANIPVGTISVWAAANNYKYIVTVDAGTLSVGTPIIVAWTNVDAGSVTY